VVGHEIRLNKFISDSGFCSRREADKLIEKKRVRINGLTPELGTKVQQGDKVTVDGFDVKASAKNKSDRIYIAYNKPIGITCTTESHVRGNIIAAIGHKKRIFPIGRLDKPSEGLIFLTSDGDIVNKILRAENAHDKEYIVSVDKPISERFIERMSKGVPILGTITKPCIVTMKSKFVFSIILTQGLNRQIRRMCEYLDYEVKTLKRSRIMNVTLGSLKPGQWRDLTIAEMAEINSAVANSTKTANGEPDAPFDDVDVEYIESNDVENIKSPIDTSALDFNRGKSSKTVTTKKPKLSLKRK
jgi:23S rRNA pseudouridine2604 synthase